jgi:RHS repeat-associated protein
VDPTTTSATSCQQANLQGTTSFSDALGRPIASDDPLGTGVGTNGSGCFEAITNTHHTACASYSVVVAASTAGLPGSDSEPYLRTLAIDPSLRQTASYTDALGRLAYAQRFDGASKTPLGSGIVSYAVSSYLYDPLGRLRQVTDAAGNLTTFTYDALGRLTSSSDPDLGAWSYQYDANGNVTQQTDGRGTAGGGTVYAAYDGLDRQLWLGPNSNGSTPYASYTYDGAAPCSGSYLVGRLCQESFASGPSQSVTGSYTYAYDARGRPTSTSFTITGPSTPQTTYTLSASYDDADRPSVIGYPAIGGSAETLTFNYANAAGGGLSALASSIINGTGLLFSSPSYTTAGLLAGWQSGSVSGGYQASLSLAYDGDLRVTDDKVSLTPSGGGAATTVAESQPTYNASGDVATLTTTLAAVGSSSGGSETQAFCYDLAHRLVWASALGGGGPCSRVGSEGISGAGYSASYSYDTLGRITSAAVTTSGGGALANTAQGSYSYDATHVHEVTAVGSGSTGYAAAYDAAGDQTCRVVGSTSGCTGIPTGQTLVYDNLRRLISWRGSSSLNAPTGSYAYDGAGERVWQQATQTVGQTTTTTTITYVLGVEEVTTTAVSGQQPTTTTTSYYPLPGGLSASRDASGLTYQASDLLGTPIAALSLTSGVRGTQLRAPYGQARFAASASSNGGLHTTFGFTGQREDTQAPGSSGLDYYGARYYDPVVGRFTSADDVHPSLGDPVGLDGFSYVGGQVESATDPSGHFLFPWDDRGGKVTTTAPDEPKGIRGGLGPYNNAPGGPDGPPDAPATGSGTGALAPILAVAAVAIIAGVVQGDEPYNQWRYRAAQQAAQAADAGGQEDGWNQRTWRVSVYGRYCTTSSRPKCTTSSRPKCTVWSAAYAG